VLQFILGLLGVDPLGKILDGLRGAYADKLKAGNDLARIDADVEIKRLESALALHQEATRIRLATAGFGEMRLLTFLIALPFVIHVSLVGIGTNFGALFGWDWALHIPAFPAPFNEWEAQILLSFFGLQAGSIAVKAVAAGLSGRKS